MSNANDKAYLDFLTRLSRRYKERTAGQPVFTTAVDKIAAWDKYLSSFENRQYHNCNACHSFLNRYAGLVVIADNGQQKSALWDEDDADNGETAHAIRRLAVLAKEAKVNGVFYSDESKLGLAANGQWRHLHVFNPAVYMALGKTARQAMAEKREQFAMLNRALREFDHATVVTAVKLVLSNTLYRGNLVQPQAEWLDALYTKIEQSGNQHNLTWQAVAKAPDGFAHVKSTMLGGLLEDIKEGRSTKEIIDRFANRMDVYKQAQTPVTENQIAVAERAVQELGIAPAFARRFTKVGDFGRNMIMLRSGDEEPTPREQSTPASGGVFDVLKTKKQAVADNVVVPPRPVTLEKFLRDVLPGAAKIQYRVPEVGRFCAMTTAANPDAPPILQWDRPDDPNTVSWAFANQPARAEDYSLVPGSLATVQAVVQPAQGQGAFFLLQGARDTRELPGGGLFVEHLRSDLLPYRKTIEAYLNKMVVDGANDPDTMAFGIGLLAGNDWTEIAAPQPVETTSPSSAPKRVHVLLVVDDSGSMASYLSAAQRAVQHLLDSTSAMPGEVDYTVFKFGGYVTKLCERAGLPIANGSVANLRASSGSTSLNDAIGDALEITADWSTKDTAFFLGIITDGEENHSTRYDIPMIRSRIRAVLATKAWTVAYAGAGNRPRDYAEAIGVPPNNVKVFEASARGFEDVGRSYAAGTKSLAAGYRAGARATDSFFSAVSGRHAIGTDHPVLLVTMRTGAQIAYKLDRWE